MKPTPAFSRLLFLLIPLTFTWKLVAAEHQALHDPQGNIARFLMSHDFDVKKETPVYGVPIVRATKGDCHMIVGEASPDGTTRYIMYQIARTMDQHFVVFRGTIYDEQPTWLAITEDWWGRYLRKLGISRSQALPIVIAASYSCGAERLPWTELSAGS